MRRVRHFSRFSRSGLCGYHEPLRVRHFSRFSRSGLCGYHEPLPHCDYDVYVAHPPDPGNPRPTPDSRLLTSLLSLQNRGTSRLSTGFLFVRPLPPIDPISVRGKC